ncbi:MAG: MBL fold metallo-hydrolase [Anaerovoracaceae bacterium]
MELRQAGERTYYIEHSTNIGVYMTSPGRVCLIDTGAKGDGEKIDEMISGQGWSIDYIINTHTHIDHLGGNEYLMKKYHIPAYCTEYDMAFAHYSDLEAAYMNGGFPCRKLRTIFSHPGMIGFRSIEKNSLEGIEWVYLPGHTFGMIGVKTSDDVWFLADSYLSRRYLEKRSFGYLYDVGGYLDTLEFIKNLEGQLFIPAHGIAETDISEVADLNRANIERIIESIKKICSDEISLDEILKRMYEAMGMRTTVSQHALLSSTTKCYLTYLQDRGELECGFTDNVMTWRTV